jgi:FixJ family two-component response regulator
LTAKDFSFASSAQAGAVAFLRKPVSEQDLISAIQAALRW